VYGGKDSAPGFGRRRVTNFGTHLNGALEGRLKVIDLKPQGHSLARCFAADRLDLIKPKIYRTDLRAQVTGGALERPNTQHIRVKFRQGVHPLSKNDDCIQGGIQLIFTLILRHTCLQSKSDLADFMPGRKSAPAYPI
jgi:hypothetical protein